MEYLFNPRPEALHILAGDAWFIIQCVHNETGAIKYICISKDGHFIPETHGGDLPKLYGTHAQALHAVMEVFYPENPITLAEVTAKIEELQAMVNPDA